MNEAPTQDPTHATILIKAVTLNAAKKAINTWAGHCKPDMDDLVARRAAKAHLSISVPFLADPAAINDALERWHNVTKSKALKTRLVSWEIKGYN